MWLLEERLFTVAHHHVVFTLPKMVRAYFRYDQGLLNGLSRGGLPVRNRIQTSIPIAPEMGRIVGWRYRLRSVAVTMV